LAGAITDAMAAPLVYAAKMIGIIYPSKSAVCTCKLVKTTFELVLLPVLKALIAPIHRATSGKG